MSHRKASWSARSRPGQLGLRRLLFVLWALCPVTAVRAQEASTPAITGGIETETDSRYLWRGLAFSEGTVQQSNFYAAAAHFTGSLWLNHEYASPAGTSLNEIDLSFEYALSLGPLAVEPSFAHYSYPNQDESPSTDELGVRLSWNLGLLTLQSEQSLDIKTYPGAYYGDLGLLLQADATERLSVETGAYFGWSSSEFAVAYVGEAPQPFHVAGISGRLYYYPARWLYLSPHLSYSSILSPGYTSLLAEPNLWQVGLAVGSDLP